ncbi:MAG: prolipoprotein diacylglyceryl transferase [Phycisphaerales bacterium]|nr:prolipoprotein diacylglyceryl transferase [Phycisphaerales bacterium]
MAARVAYGAVFCVVLPALLVLWARRLDGVLPLPAIGPSPVGWGVAAGGALLMIWAMVGLRTMGGGLPMNAFPPSRPVVAGPYAVFAHPIYVGAVAVAFGVSFAVGSAAGAWIVSPILTLGCVALVWGYEAQDLQLRFGTVPGGRWLRLPEASDEPPGWRDVVCAWFGLFVPFLVLFEAIGHVPVPGAVDIAAYERAWPTFAATTPLYSSVYPLVALVPLVFVRRRDLRGWMLDAWLGVFIGLLAFVVVPVVYPPRPFDHGAPFAWLLALEQSDGVDGRASLPSFHVFWAFLAARACWSRGRGVGAAANLLAMGVATACVTTGMHSVADVVAGVVLMIVAAGRVKLWVGILGAAERIANSWKEWRLGPVRVLSHSPYPGIGAALGVGVVGAASGVTGATAASVVGVCSLAGACLWGQYWTGSPRLLRPFGYFGGLIAAVCVVPVLALVWPSGVQGWQLGGALAVAGPWIQAIGRVRCLIQGCCHGRKVERCEHGIRYRHPRSRVITVASLGGVPLHATPVYSMLSNAVIGVLLWRLVSIDAPASFVVGAYLLLTGLARFVEESLRGEPQTHVYARLRLYQWCAVGSVVLGACLTCVRSEPVRWIGWDGAGGFVAVMALALMTGVVHALAMGVDFPGSNRRFARLADA